MTFFHPRHPTGPRASQAGPAERLKLWLLSVWVTLALSGLVAQVCGWETKASPVIQLGARLFGDSRFSNPNGDLPASCSHCHILDENAQGMRAYTDFLARSWVPFRLEDPRRDALRNAPTIFDVGEMPLLHFDGEFTSLEDLAKGTLTGRSLGWLPGEEQKASERVQRVVISDGGEGTERSYKDLFKAAYGIDVEKLDRSLVVDSVARALADYMRSLKTERNSPFDKFTQRNGLPAGPEKGETAHGFAQRLTARVSELDRKHKLQLTDEFGADALNGLRIFFASGGSPAGNCAACHVPPLFTDFSFHNTGISQVEYDRVHGDGSFTQLAIPDAAAAIRPSAQFRETPSAARPGYVDLGYWNFVKLSDPRLRRPGETEDALLRRMIAAFKTPTLRNLAYSEPYMHNGAYPTLQSVLSELMRLGGLARAGRIREADPDLAKIRIGEADIAPLIAFLNTLNGDLKAKYHR